MDSEKATLNNLIGQAIGRRLSADGGRALRIRCIAYPESSAHYADAVLVSASSLTLSIDGVADTTVGTAGVITISSGVTNLGLLVDAINLSANWQAEIVAGMRSDAINGAELLARSTSTFKMREEVSIYFDSSDNGVYGISFLLEPGAAFDPESAVGHRVALNRVQWYCNTNSAEVHTMAAYELKPDKASSLRTLAAGSAADSAEGDTGAINAPLVNADYGNSILVRITSTGWIDTAAYLQVFGQRQ